MESHHCWWLNPSPITSSLALSAVLVKVLLEPIAVVLDKSNSVSWQFANLKQTHLILGSMFPSHSFVSVCFLGREKKAETSEPTLKGPSLLAVRWRCEPLHHCVTISPNLILLYKSFPFLFLCLHTNKDCHCSVDQWKHNRDLLSNSRADLITVLGVNGSEVANVPLLVDVKISLCSCNGPENRFGTFFFTSFSRPCHLELPWPATSKPVNG